MCKKYFNLKNLTHDVKSNIAFNKNKLYFRRKDVCQHTFHFKKLKRYKKKVLGVTINKYCETKCEKCDKVHHFHHDTIRNVNRKHDGLMLCNQINEMSFRPLAPDHIVILPTVGP
jgi:hypothetical protein